MEDAPDADVLRELLDRVDLAFAALPGDEGHPLGIRGRVRAERLVRLRGPWSLRRLHDGLRACLCASARQRAAFERAFRETFGELTDADLDALPSLEETEHPAPVTLPPRPRVPRPRPPEPGWPAVLLALLLAQGAVAAVGAIGGAAVFALAWTPHHADAPPHDDDGFRPPPPPPLTPPSADLLADWRRPAPPAPIVSYFPGPPDEPSPYAVPASLLGVAALLAAAAWIALVARRRLAPAVPWPAPPADDATPFTLDPPPLRSAPIFDRRALDALADAVGLVLDPDRVQSLDVPASVRETSRRAGLLTERFRLARQTRAVCVLVDAASPALARLPVDRALADGLATRGLTVLRAEWWGTPERLQEARGAWTTLDLLLQREPDAILLLVGEAWRVQGALPPDLLHRERVAWIDPTDPSTWTTLHARWPLPLFAATAEGLDRLTRWIARGERPPRLEGAPAELPGSAFRALRMSQAALSGADRAMVERRLGASLPWVAVLALYPGVVPGWYADQLREELVALAPARWPALAAPLAGVGPLALDRVRALPFVREVPEGLELGGALRACLIERLRASWPTLHRWALARHIRELEAQRPPAGSEAALEREVRIAGLRWRQVDELDEREVAELLEQLRRLAGTRLGAELRIERSAQVGGVRMAPAPDGRGWTDSTRRLLADVEGEPVPAPWRSVDRVGVAVLAIMGLGLVGAGVELARPNVAYTDQLAISGAELLGGPEHLAWVVADEGATPVATAWWAGHRVHWVHVPKPERVRAGASLDVQLASGGDGGSMACADGDSLATTTILRCPPPGYEPIPHPGVGAPLTVAHLSPERLTGPKAEEVERFLRLLFRTGSVDLVVIGGETGDGPLGTFGDDREWLPGGATGRKALDLDAYLYGAIAAAEPLYSGSGGSPERVMIDTMVGNEDLWTLPTWPISPRCTDARGRDVGCAWTASPDDAPAIQRGGSLAADGSRDGSTTLAEGLWHATVTASGLPQLPQDFVIPHGGPAPDLVWNLGARRYPLSLRLDDEETAVVDGVPRRSGESFELEEGDYSFALSLGCQQVTRTLHVAPEGWNLTQPVGEAGRWGRPVRAVVDWQRPVVRVVGYPPAGRADVYVDGVVAPQARLDKGSAILPADLPPGSHVIRVDVRSAEDPPATIATGSVTLDWACTANPFPPSLYLAPVASPVVTTADPLDADPIGRPTGRTWTLRTPGKERVEAAFIELSAGEFTMGSKEGEGNYDERPRHRVVLDRSFLIGATEVTQALWKSVGSGNPSTNVGDQLPIDDVPWCDAADFANRLSEQQHLSLAYPELNYKACDTGGDVRWDRSATGFRLPTEAEWEYAARAGTSTPWPWGADEASLRDHAWYSSNSGDETHRVRTKGTNPWGLADMAGNVWEWVWDWTDVYPTEATRNPIGPNFGSDRMSRGGSAGLQPDRVRSASRQGWFSPVGRGFGVGFRLVLPSPPPSEPG